MNQKSWSKTPAGEEVICYTFEDASGVSFTAMNFGAHITSLIVPDRDGNPADIALGFDSVEGYINGAGYLGANVAPNGNRIGGASFTLNGKTYELDKNDGNNNLHSGFSALHLKIWNVESVTDNSITFSYDKKDGECGFPGNCKLTTTYTVEDGALRIDYSCTTDADTVFNPTNHTYFNLAGHNSGPVYDQVVWIDAKTFTYTDSELIPNGVLTPVEGTPLDFNTPHTIGERINEQYEALIYGGGGYDQNFVVADGLHELSLVAYIEDPASGRHMDIFTDLPGIQMYSGNGLGSSPADKDGASYGRHGAVCFETQFHPNAVNIPEFTQPIVKAGETFNTTTIYKFTTI